MSLYPLSAEDLISWEEWLNHLNHECIVPSSYLSKVLSSDIRNAVLQRELKSSQNIPYNAKHAHLSKRYVNEAWIWTQVLQPLLPAEKITELCGGASIVIDLALSYLGFSESFTKIDYQSWDHLERYNLKNCYQMIFKDLNVIAETDVIPKADIIILNHSVDDLYIGLWNDRHQQNYWGEFCNWEKVDASWELAMQELDLYLPLLKAFIKKIVTRLNFGGTLILRDYPSAYETHRKQLKRINWTRQLTQSLIQEVIASCMTQQHLELDDSYPPLVQETFFVYTRI